MANGKVIIGYSDPWVALYSAEGTTITYTDAQALARGVSVSTSISTNSVEDFYADNGSAESGLTTFAGGTVSLTVDGLKQDAEKLIMGITKGASETFIGYSSALSIPYVGIGYVIKYREDGKDIYTPFLFTKCDFVPVDISAETQGSSINWQTQDLTANIREDATGLWKKVFDDCTTRADAATVIKTALGVTTSA